MSQLRKVGFLETVQLFSFVYLICFFEAQFEEHTKTKGTILCSCSKHIFASQISLQKSQSHQSKKKKVQFLPPQANVMFGHVYSFKGEKHQNLLLPFTIPYLICYIYDKYISQLYDIWIEYYFLCVALYFLLF